MDFRKLVLIVGAGGTYAESLFSNKHAPLDRGFFKLCESEMSKDKNFAKVKEYILNQ